MKLLREAPGGSQKYCYPTLTGCVTDAAQTFVGTERVGPSSTSERHKPCQERSCRATRCHHQSGTPVESARPLGPMPLVDKRDCLHSAPWHELPGIL